MSRFGDYGAGAGFMAIVHDEAPRRLGLRVADTVGRSAAEGRWTPIAD